MRRPTADKFSRHPSLDPSGGAGPVSAWPNSSPQDLPPAPPAGLGPGRRIGGHHTSKEGSPVAPTSTMLSTFFSTRRQALLGRKRRRPQGAVRGRLEGSSGTAYRIRTGGLRLERAVSWASRRMRPRQRGQVLRPRPVGMIAVALRGHQTWRLARSHEFPYATPDGAMWVAQPETRRILAIRHPGGRTGLIRRNGGRSATPGGAWERGAGPRHNDPYSRFASRNPRIDSATCW